MLFLGTQARGANRLEFPAHPKIQVRRLPFCAAGFKQKLHYLRFMLWCLVWSLRWRPKWIYASDPLSCPVALILSYLPGWKVLYHEHDSPAFAFQLFSFEGLVMLCRRRLAQRAALCVLPNEKRVERFKETTGTKCPVLCVWNCPAREEAGVAPCVRNDGYFIVFYHGSIVPARLPQTVLEALKLLPPNVLLRIAGYETVGHEGYAKRLVEQAAALGIAGRIQFLGSLPQRQELLEQCREASVGLALMPLDSKDQNEQSMAGASNKPFDYLACGLPVVVSDLPAWRQMFVAPGYALTCNPDKPESIEAALRWFVTHGSETRQMSERGRGRILREWNYEARFRGVLHELEGDKDRFR